MIGCRDSYRLIIIMENTNKLNVKKARINGVLYSMSVGYKIDNKSGVSFLYGTLSHNLKVEESNNIVEVTFRYAPAKYKEPLLLNLKVNSNKTNFTNDKQKSDYKKIIAAIINTLDESIKKDLLVTNPINTKVNNDITPIEGLDDIQQEQAPIAEDNKDEVIKKLLEDNANLREENNRLKDIINKQSQAKEEAVVTTTETFDADKLMITMRKEFNKKIESLRKEMMDKLANTTVVTKTEEPTTIKEPVVEIKEETLRSLTAEELLETKELDDMTFQELQKIGKYFKIGADNNSPRPQLVEILKQHVNPVIEKEQPEIVEETITEDNNDIPELFEEDNTDELTVVTTTNNESDLSDLQKELLADLQNCL